MLKAIDDVIDSPDTCNHRQQGFITYSDSKRNWKSCRLVMICSGLQTAGACVFALCSAGIMQKLPIDATGPRSAFRAWGVLCGVRVLPQSPEPRAPLSFSLTRVSRGQNTRRCHPCCICTLPTLHRMTLLAFAGASRWHALATRDMPFLRYCRSRCWCGAHHLVSEPVSSLLIVPYAVWTYAMAGRPGQQSYCSNPISIKM